MMPKGVSLAEWNPYLRDAATREYVIHRAVITSTAVELGAHRMEEIAGWLRRDGQEKTPRW